MALLHAFESVLYAALLQTLHTPKKKRATRATRLQHSHFVDLEVVRLRKRQNSPYGTPAEPKNKVEKAITRIKA